ncbi:MAG: C39 family peptidase [Candidatus Buchananbacteria bacterium]|nr:C39 family peptidase [Candidatus Buchananbacteria bacterium]
MLKVIKNFWLVPFCLALVFVLAGCQHKMVELPVDQTNFDKPTTTDESLNSVDQPVIPETKVIEIKPPAEEKVITSTSVSDRLIYQVPFTSQAPLGVWDDLHEESCEEAVMIMADAYFNHKNLTKNSAEQEILNLVEWENNNNFLVDLNAQEFQSVLSQYFSLSSELIVSVTPETIKQQLNLGRLVIVPTAGRQLGNPHFTGIGPIYHMVLIKGYDGQNFITNDPGTRHGESYVYPYAQLINAVHDWQHDLAVDGMTDAEMETGRKVMIVIFKN